MTTCPALRHIITAAAAALVLATTGCAAAPTPGRVSVATPTPTPHGWWAAITKTTVLLPPEPNQPSPSPMTVRSTTRTATSTAPTTTRTTISATHGPGDPPGIRIVVIPADVLFASGSAQLSPAARSELDNAAADLTGAAYITVAGHADNTNHPVNQHLSTERGEAAAAEMRAYVVGTHIAAIGCSDGYPVASNDNASGRARNRRVTLMASNRPLTNKQACTADQPSPTDGP